MTVAILDHTGRPYAKPQPTRLQVAAKFDAAQTTNKNSRHWVNADHLGPNAELSPIVRSTVVSRARYEVSNNTYAAGMLKTLANDTIGTGPSLQITAKDVAETDAAEVQERFWEWGEAIRLPQKLRTARLSKARDGEVFGLMGQNPKIRVPVQLDLRLIETEMVASPLADYDPDRTLTDGIIYDDFDNVVGYTVLREHPGEAGIAFGLSLGEVDVLPARDVIHLYNEDRPGQARGMSEITPALPLYAMLRRYTLAVVESAELAALLSWIIQSRMNPETLTPTVPMDLVDTERGMGLVMPAGWEGKQMEAEQPTSTYPDFKKEIIAEIARCLGMPFNVAAGNSSGYNYSSGRLDHRTYYKSLRVERSTIESKCLEVLFRVWWMEARLIQGYLPDRFYRAPVPMHEWRWDGDEHVDPTKEADAAETRLGIGLTTFHDETSRLGGDAEVVQAKNAAYLGLTLEAYRALQCQRLFGVDPNPPQPPTTEASDGEEDEAE